MFVIWLVLAVALPRERVCVTLNSSVEAFPITILSLKIKGLQSRHVPAIQRHFILLNIFTEKEEQSHPPTKIQKLCNVHYNHSKKAYFVSHILKNKLKQYNISLQQRHNEKNAMIKACFVHLQSQCTPSVYPLGTVKIEHIALCNSPKAPFCHDSLSMQCYTEETQLTPQLPGTGTGHAAVAERGVVRGFN